jgi:TPP-dependent 2-oxoacid decarboxylase
MQEQIHSGSYNQIQPWSYGDLVNAFQDADDKFGWSMRVFTEGELMGAILRALDTIDQLALIEVVLDSSDCTAELLEFGRCVSMANQRPYVPTTTH